MKLIDLHTHTTPASGCSRLRPEDLIKRAKQLGLDGVCLTEHHASWNTYSVRQLARRHDFTLFRGVEITTQEGDVLVYGPHIFGLPYEIQGIISAQKLREMVALRGGAMVAAHPLRGSFLSRDGHGSAEFQQKIQELSGRPFFRWVDAIEGLNGNTAEIQNRGAQRICELLGLPTTGGSDAHLVSDVGRYVTGFEQEITDDRELAQALREGACQAVALEAWHRGVSK
ncbi:MAG: PHP domain-containing protein [Candidatus Tectomicrobia bacterium]|uniref:PHP domain-containing protein n=1 Tax=Tectimicrobiota bacterium TaxID=2528274 RepID=A0A932CPP5_UNCTE|nr:PHP domain-containing protein [Candidatus Tectomicrobia bacterium]